MPARPHRRRATGRSALALVALAVLAGGCAKKGMPSGGPPDIEPPRLVGSQPDSGAARVARDAELSVTFSEGMEPRTTGDAVALAPRVDIRQRRWSGRTLTLVLDDSLGRDQTYTLFVGGNAHDRHGNAISGGATIVFTTADSFPRGLLEGVIEARGFPVSGTYLWCYDADRGHLPDSTARDFDAVGLADREGHFRVPGLRVPGRWKLWAFADLNGNRSFEPTVDVLAPADTVIALTADAPEAHGLSVRVVNPRAPGHAIGRVAIAGSVDSTVVPRVWTAAEADTTHPVTFDVRGDGTFDCTLTAGAWRLRVFLDRNHDQRWQPASEPAGELVHVTVPPAGDVRDLVLHLAPREPERKEGP